MTKILIFNFCWKYIFESLIHFDKVLIRYLYFNCNKKSFYCIRIATRSHFYKVYTPLFIKRCIMNDLFVRFLRAYCRNFLHTLFLRNAAIKQIHKWLSKLFWPHQLWSSSALKAVVDGRCQVQSPVALADLAIRRFPWYSANTG